jgi:hypothetical protein
MDKTVFTSKVDKRSRKAMEEYLGGHYTYCDHYRIGYAHKVKLHNLKLPDYDVAYELIEDEFTWVPLNEIIKGYNDSWLGRTASIHFAGRSGGYIMLDFVSGDLGVFDARYDADMYFDDLKWIVEIVQEFDQCVQDVYECFYAMCEEE